jgi:hypothetical protein
VLAWMVVAWQMEPAAKERIGVEARGKLPASH